MVTRFFTNPKDLTCFGCTFRYLIMVSKAVNPQVMEQSSVISATKRLMDCGFKQMKFSFTYAVLKLEHAGLNGAKWMWMRIMYHKDP